MFAPLSCFGSLTCGFCFADCQAERFCCFTIIPFELKDHTHCLYFTIWSLSTYRVITLHFLSRIPPYIIPKVRKERYRNQGCATVVTQYVGRDGLGSGCMES